MFQRSLSAGQLLYGYVDTTHTFTAAMLNDLGPLVNPDPTQGHESLMYMLGGAYVILGSRDQGNTSQRLYDTVTISYNAFHPESSSLVDLIYAVGKSSATRPWTTGSSSRRRSCRTTRAIARVVGAGLAFKNVANQHAEAKIPPSPPSGTRSST